MYILQLENIGLNQPGDMWKIRHQDVDDPQLDRELSAGLRAIVGSKHKLVVKCEAAFDQLRIYLEEKGIEFQLGRARRDMKGKTTASRKREVANPQILIIENKTGRLYKEVVSHGLDSLFETYNIEVHSYDSNPHDDPHDLPWELRVRFSK